VLLVGLWLQELLAIQQQGPRNIGFFGTRNMGFLHQQLIEILSYAMVITVRHHVPCAAALATPTLMPLSASRAVWSGLLLMLVRCALGSGPLQNNHIYTSGAAGTNAAVIRGALRAERPDPAHRHSPAEPGEAATGEPKSCCSRCACRKGNIGAEQESRSPNVR